MRFSTSFEVVGQLNEIETCLYKWNFDLCIAHIINANINIIANINKAFKSSLKISYNIALERLRYF